MEKGMSRELDKNSEIVKNLQLIADKEPEFFAVTEELVKHLAGTYGDKYEASKNFINTKEQLYHPEVGVIISSYQISRYLQRFTAPDSYKKGGNKNDLLKICHYALFACVAKDRTSNVKNVDHKD